MGKLKLVGFILFEINITKNGLNINIVTGIVLVPVLISKNKTFLK